MQKIFGAEKMAKGDVHTVLIKGTKTMAIEGITTAFCTYYTYIRGMEEYTTYIPHSKQHRKNKHLGIKLI